jgi:uncharacterized protein YaiL (DUF2058 family)
MSHSLRDQLLGLGFKPAPKAERPAPPPKPVPPRGHERHTGKPAPDAARAGVAKRDGASPQGRPEHAKRKAAGSAAHSRAPRSQQDIDLAKAYAIRAQKEKDERIEAERLRQEEARLRREAKAKLAELLKDKALNDPAAEIARHFEYGGKIKRIYVNAEQLTALNAGELGVVQVNGRYLLVTAAVLAEAEAVFEPSVALKVDPNAPPSDDPYADPAYQVPDDLVW